MALTKVRGAGADGLTLSRMGSTISAVGLIMFDIYKLVTY